MDNGWTFTRGSIIRETTRQLKKSDGNVVFRHPEGHPEFGQFQRDDLAWGISRTSGDNKEELECWPAEKPVDSAKVVEGVGSCLEHDPYPPSVVLATC